MMPNHMQPASDPILGSLLPSIACPPILHHLAAFFV